VTDDDIRALLAALPDADGFLAKPRDYVAKARPDAASLEAAGTDLKALDAWVQAHGGQVRSVRAASGGGVGPGRRVAPPPSAPGRCYVLPASSLSA
jgi:hypothetical protein